ALHVTGVQTCALPILRTLTPEARDICESRISELAEKVPRAFGAAGVVEYVRRYPPTINHPEQARILGDAASRVVGEQNVERNMKPLAASEDFSFFLQKKPGAFIFIGNGATPSLHHPRYDFNDEALPYGIALWRELVQGRE